jgi:uncharacterized protein involved in exopolysaccharide biosynthesis
MLGFLSVLAARGGRASLLAKGRFPGTTPFASSPRGLARESTVTQHEGFLNLLAVIVNRRRFLFWNSLLVTLAVLSFSFFLPTRYKATSTILFPRDSGENLTGLSALVQQFDISRNLLSGPTSNTQIYLAILKSRTIADSVVVDFDLVHRYKVKNMEGARRRLRALSEFNLTSGGVIEISVEDTDREMAARLANAFVTHLDALNRSTRMGEGKRTRIFIEKRLSETTARLNAAEDSLRAFQESHPGVALPPEAATAAGAAADLMAQRISLGAEVEVLQGSLHPQATALVRKRAELSALDRELEGMPLLSLEIARRYRDVKVQQAVFELLTAQYEEARIQESKDQPTVEVLDTAIPPLRKSFPHRGIMTVVALFFSLVVGLLVAAFLETMDRLRPAMILRFRNEVGTRSLIGRVLFRDRERKAS